MKIAAARRALVLAENRLADHNLPAYIADELLHRCLNDFEEAVEPSGKFAGLIEQCRIALRLQDYVELVSGITLLRTMMPRATYGELNCGARFSLGDLTTVTFVKGPNGVHLNGRIYPHPADDATVTLHGEC